MNMQNNYATNSIQKHLEISVVTSANMNTFTIYSRPFDDY